MSLSEADEQVSEHLLEVLLISGDPRSPAEVRRLLEGSAYRLLVASDAEAGLAEINRRTPHAVLLEESPPAGSGLDVLTRLRDMAPTTAILFSPASVTGEGVIEAVKRAARDLLPRPYDPTRFRISIDEAVAFGGSRLGNSSATSREPIEAERTLPTREGELLGNGPAMQSIYKQIGRVAPLDVPVLIQGEHGTEKADVAAAIHRHSGYATGPLVVFSCLAEEASQSEPELFGATATSASAASPGKVDEAAGGTLVLQDVESASLGLQAKLVAALREGHYESGSGERRPFSCRLVAITSEDLAGRVQAKRFRSDLYYLLASSALALPPLRQRAGDLRQLVERVLRRLTPLTRAYGVDRPEVSEEAWRAIGSYHWPGNLEELESVLKRSLIEQRGHVLAVSSAIQAIGGKSATPTVASAGTSSSTTDWASFADLRIEAGGDTLHAEAVAETERKLFARVLRHTRGNQAQAARLLGITRASLRKKLRMYGMVAKQAGEAGPG